jgi:hypothetical protein
MAATHGRVTEWEISVQDGGFGLRLFASAQYGRGSRPTDVEIEILERRIRLKFPKAELISLNRRLVPCVGGGASRRVRWELQWIVREG